MICFDVIFLYVYTAWGLLRFLYIWIQLLNVEFFQSLFLYIIFCLPLLPSGEHTLFWDFNYTYDKPTVFIHRSLRLCLLFPISFSYVTDEQFVLLHLQAN